MAKVDESGKTVSINNDGLVKVDGIPAMRRIVRDGRIYIQFRDDNRVKAACRGTGYVEVPLEALCEKLSMGTSWQQEQIDA